MRYDSSLTCPIEYRSPRSTRGWVIAWQSFLFSLGAFTRILDARGARDGRVRRHLYKVRIMGENLVARGVHLLPLRYLCRKVHAEGPRSARGWVIGRSAYIFFAPFIVDELIWIYFILFSMVVQLNLGAREARVSTSLGSCTNQERKT